MMSPLHKIVSFFQSDSLSNRKKLLPHKLFSSEVNISSDIEELKRNQWGTLNGYHRTKGKTEQKKSNYKT